MRKILLFRHGKSSWSDPDQEDMDRPLNGRGRMASALMGAWMSEIGVTEALVLLSPALRAVQSWERAAANMSGKFKTETDKALYMADPKTMLKVIQGASKKAETLIVVGHQPSMSAFARKLTGGKASGGCRRAFEKFPTGAVAVLGVEKDDWSKLDFGDAEFLDFATPKDLV